MNTRIPDYRFQVYADSAGKWRWRLITAKGRKIAASGEAFASKANAVRSARLVQRVARRAPVKIVTPPLRRAA
jgi:uncharacterized protein YegP (UPF0339 family)